MNLSKVFKALALAGLAILAILVYSQKINFSAVDLGRHLENGKIVWQDSGVLFRNFYSYTEPNFPFINHHWLYGAIVYAIYMLGGFTGLSLFNIAAGLAAFFIFFFIAKKRSNFYTAAILSLPVIVLLSERVEVRPEMISYLFIGLAFLILDGVVKKKDYRLLWWLAPLFLLWVNTHIYFFIGLAMIAFAGLADIKNWRLRLWPYLAALSACLINPNTWKGLVYPLNIFHNYGYEIAENKSVFFLEKISIDGNFLIFKILLVSLLASWALYYYKTKRIRISDFLASIFFSGLALFSSRNISMFGLVALPIVAANTAPFLKRYGRAFPRYLSVTIFFMALIAIFMFLVKDERGNQEIIRNDFGLGVAEGYDDSYRFFKDNGLSGPVFNNYDIGSALIFWLDDKEKVFVDNRPEAYSASFFTDVYKPMQSDYGVWQGALKEYNFKTIYFSHTDGTPWASQFVFRILHDSSWYLLYFDADSIILSSDEKHKGKAISQEAFVKRYDELFKKSNVKQKLSLASLAISAGYYDLAQDSYQEMLSDNPKDYKIKLALAGLYLSSGNAQALRESLNYYQSVLDRGIRLSYIYDQMAMAHWQLNEYASAKSYWEKALRRNKKDKTASSYLDQLKDLQIRGQLSF